MRDEFTHFKIDRTQPVRPVRYDNEMINKSEKLAFRLSDILTRLFMGEVLTIEQLMNDYQVSDKTLRRDFNERLIKAPIVKNEDGYKLAPLSRVNSSNIQKILNNTGLSSLLPCGMPLQHIDNTLLFKNPRTENTEQLQGAFKQLTTAILRQSIISFTYRQQVIEAVSPYLLVNDRGCWYLAAALSGALYSYRLSKITNIKLSDSKFTSVPKVREDIYRQGMEWITADNADVLLQVDHDIAHLFVDGYILPNQQILKELADGSVLVSCRVTKLSEIIPILKAWMPQIEVLSPVSLKLELMRELYASLERF